MLRRWRRKDCCEGNDVFGQSFGKYKNPKLVLNLEKQNFFDFTIDDFSMKNYEPMQPQLKLELGI
jgi:thymidylate synthase